MSRNVRLRFSGLVIFSARLLSIITGLVFLTITTRTLTQGQFGAWQNISNIAFTASLGASIIPFWAARYTARNFSGSVRLGLLTNMAVGIPVAILGAVIGMSLFAPAAKTSGIYYIYGSLLIVQAYLIGALDPVVSLTRTHILGYAYATYEIIRVVAVYTLMVVFNVGIPGAITAIFLANFGWFGVYSIVLREHWREKLTLIYLKQWLSGSFLIFFTVIANFLTTLEGFIIILLAGPVALAYFGIAVAVSIPIAFTSALSTALYPKLLAGGTGEDVESAWKITLLFSLPLTFSIVSLSSSLLAVLRSDYVPAYLVLSLLTIRSFIGSFNPIFDAIVNGTERMDEKGLITVKEALRSRLILPPSATLITYIIYLPTLWIVLQNYASNPLLVASVTALIGLPVGLAVTAAKFLVARRYMKFRFPVLSALKYGAIGGGLALVIPILAFAGIVTLPLRPILTIQLFFLGAGVYFAVLYLIDEEARTLIDAILTRIIGELRAIPILRRIASQ